MSEEEWRPVVGLEGFYEVSDHGRVRSVDRVFTRADGQRQGRRGRLLRTTLAGNRRQYPSITLRHGRRRPVHVLVCAAFHGPKPTPSSQVAHGNGVPTDNRASNLRWASPAENSADALEHGTRRLVRGEHGEANGNARITWDIAEAIRRACASGSTQASQAALHGLGKTQVHNIVAGKSWRDEWKP